MSGVCSNGNFSGANLDSKLYSQLTRIENSPLADVFFSSDNLNVIQNGLVDGVNHRLHEANPTSKCKISRQSDREVLLLMIEFFHFHTTQVSSGMSNFYVGKKNSVYNQIPVPASMMFTDPGDSYIPGWFDKFDSNYGCAYGRERELVSAGGRKNYGDTHYLKKHLPNTIPRRCVGEDRYTDNSFYNEKLPMSKRVGDLNQRFLEFLIPKVIYEIRNKLKYDYFTFDPYACLVDYPAYETDRKNKGLSYQKYYNGKEEIYKPRRKNNYEFPHLRRELQPEQYNCITERTLDADIINHRIPQGETDILFPRSKIEKRLKERRQNSYLYQ